MAGQGGEEKLDWLDLEFWPQTDLSLEGLEDMNSNAGLNWFGQPGEAQPQEEAHSQQQGEAQYSPFLQQDTQNNEGGINSVCC